jgi:hypothetical protein
MTNNKKHLYGESVNVCGPLKSELSFCWRAVSRSPDPQANVAMKHLYVHYTPERGTSCAATDGKALHIVSPLSTNYCHLDNGLYRVFKRTKDCLRIGRLLDPVCKFPNYRTVIPKYSYTSTLYRSGLSLYDYGSFINFTELDKKCPFALRPYDIARLGGKDMLWSVSWGCDDDEPIVFASGSYKPVVFKYDNYKAVIMPLDLNRKAI